LLRYGYLILKEPTILLHIRRNTILVFSQLLLPCHLCAQCMILEDYSDSDGWTQIGKNVEIRNGKVKYIDGAWDSSQRRVYRKLNERLNNNCKWTIEAEFTPMEFGLLNGLPWVGHSIFMLTETNKEPFTNCPDVQCSKRPPSFQHCLGIQITTPNPPDGRVYFAGLAREEGNEFHSTYIIVDSLQKSYFIKMERLDYRLVEIGIFHDSARKDHLNGSPVTFIIPGTVTGLEYIQHSNAARGDFRRRLTGELDNLCISWEAGCSKDTMPGGGGNPPVDTIDCHLQLFTPNAFTPNGDGLNEVFKPQIDGSYSNYSLQVFNRWGDLLFESDHHTIGWDGNVSNSEAPNGTYIFNWKAELKAGECIIEKREVGKFALIR